MDTAELGWRVGDARRRDDKGGMTRRFFGVGELCSGSGLSVGARGVSGEGVGRFGELRLVGVVIIVSCFFGCWMIPAA